MIRFNSIKSKITILCSGAVLLTALVLVVVIYWQKSALQAKVSVELDVLAQNEISKIAKDVYLMCRAQQESVLQSVEYNLNVARDVQEQLGKFSFSEEKVQWNAVNQITKQSQTIELQKMMIGGHWLEQNTGFDRESILVDKVQRLVGGACTIFQRMNPAGDMLRVSTNVKTSDNKRAIGTYIPAADSSGAPNPVIAAALKGQQYQGRAFVVNAWYITVYEPILDDANNVIGMLFVGVPQESVQSLRKGIMDIVVGKTGYVFVLGGTGDQKGTYIISAKGTRDGENILDAKDADGKPFIQEMVEKAVKLNEEKQIDYHTYAWKNQGEDIVRNKIAALAYFKEWDWVIGAGAYVDDYQDAQERVSESLNTMQYTITAGAIILCVLFGFLAIYISAKIANPIRQAVDFAKLVADGDLTKSIDIDLNDEVGVLCDSLNQMVSSMAEAVNSIQSGAGQVAASAEELSASSQNLASGATEQAANLEETSAAIEQLTSSIEQNSLNAHETNDITIKAAKEAEEGGHAVVETVNAMKKIAEQISIVDDIADQTNLLALNAAIEAARAGEMGKGFAVVAVEVRKLAERSQSAAKEISEVARNSVVMAEKAGKLIQSVVPAIKTASDRVQEINAACSEQSNGATQIRTAVTQLDEVTQQNSAASEESASASEELASQAQFLQETVSRFKVSFHETSQPGSGNLSSGSRSSRPMALGVKSPSKKIGYASGAKSNVSKSAQPQTIHRGGEEETFEEF